MEEPKWYYEKKRNIKSQSKSSEEAKELAELVEAKKSLWGKHKCDNKI